MRNLTFFEINQVTGGHKINDAILLTGFLVALCITGATKEYIGQSTSQIETVTTAVIGGMMTLGVLSVAVKQYVDMMLETPRSYHERTILAPDGRCQNCVRLGRYANVMHQ